LRIDTHYKRPIQTYGWQGVSKPGVIKANHAIIYTGEEEPDPRPDEQPGEGEAGMLKAIRVQARSQRDVLSPVSRVNFSKIYTIEHNVKVYDFGNVDKSFLYLLTHQFEQNWGIGGGDAEDALDDRIKEKSKKGKRLMVE
jgi:hypothetical protein